MESTGGSQGSVRGRVEAALSRAPPDPPLSSCPAPGRRRWFCTAGGQGSPPPLHQVEYTAGGQGCPPRHRQVEYTAGGQRHPPLHHQVECTAGGQGSVRSVQQVVKGPSGVYSGWSRVRQECTAGGQGSVRWRVEAALSRAPPDPPLPSCPAPGRRRWFSTAGGQGSVRWRVEAALSRAPPAPPLPACPAPGRRRWSCTAGDP